ncbi:MAG: RimK family protein [bacterium]
MDTLVVVTHRKDWPLDVRGVKVVTARDYLTDPLYSKNRRLRVVNLCRQYKYQSLGYYVSLLAEARGQRALPSVMTLQDLRSPVVLRLASDELEELIQRSLRRIGSDRFKLSVYFGRNLAQRHGALALALFKLFPAPLLRAKFVRDNEGDWVLRGLSAMAASAIPEEHRAFAIDAAESWIAGRIHRARPSMSRFDLAILWNENDPTKPSNEKAVRKFEKAAQALQISTERITKDDYGRLSEFDGLFIRVTTAVNHYSYRFARRAEAEGLVVIDDPSSILRCTNKVYLAELLERNHVPTPKTRIITKENLLNSYIPIGLPLILKKPDSSTSLGVIKADSQEELVEEATKLLEGSDLLIAQEFLPTDFDWRIGVLDGRAIYVAKYFMAAGHWQIVNYGAKKLDDLYGESECIPLDDTPLEVLKLAEKASGLIGHGFYGVDVKQTAKKFYVIEVNDNPSVDRGIEDQLLGDSLYRAVMEVFLKRMEARREGRNGKGEA